MTENKDTIKSVWLIIYGYDGLQEPLKIVCRTEEEATQIRYILENHKFDVYDIDEVKISTPTKVESNFENDIYD